MGCQLGMGLFGGVKGKEETKRCFSVRNEGLKVGGYAGRKVEDDVGVVGSAWERLEGKGKDAFL